MRTISIILTFFSIQMSYANQVSIVDQNTWITYLSDVFREIPITDTVNIEEGSIISFNDFGMSNYGTINNHGTWNNGNSFLDNYGTINNHGTLNYIYSYLNNFSGTINNHGTLNLDIASSIINYDTINNHGTLNLDNGPVIANYSTINTCAPIDNIVENENYFGTLPVIDESLCPPVVAPIPTLSQWCVIILGLFTVIFGMLAVRQRKLIFG